MKHFYTFNFPTVYRKVKISSISTNYNNSTTITGAIFSITSTFTPILFSYNSHTLSTFYNNTSFYLSNISNA